MKFKTFKTQFSDLIRVAKAAAGQKTTIAGRLMFERNVEVAKFVLDHFPHKVELAKAALFYGNEIQAPPFLKPLLKGTDDVVHARGDWSKFKELVDKKALSANALILDLGTVYTGVKAIEEGKITHPAHVEKVTNVALQTHGKIAQRFGLQKVKDYLHEKSFELSQPDTHAVVKATLNEISAQPSERHIDSLNLLNGITIPGKTKFTVTSAIKTPYSVWKRIKAIKPPGETIEAQIQNLAELFDYNINIRGGKQRCFEYTHSLNEKATAAGWTVNSITDYVNSPKSNGYKAIHVKLTKNNNTINIRIQTRGMHAAAQNEAILPRYEKLLGQNAIALFRENAPPDEPNVKFNVTFNGKVSTGHKTSVNPNLAEAIAYAQLDRHAENPNEPHWTELFSHGNFKVNAIQRNGRIIKNPPLNQLVKTGDLIHITSTTQRIHKVDRLAEFIKDRNLKRELKTTIPERVIGDNPIPIFDTDTLRPIAKSVIEIAKSYLNAPGDSYLLHVPRGSTPIFNGVIYALQELKKKTPGKKIKTLKVQFTREDTTYQQMKGSKVEGVDTIIKKVLQDVPERSSLFYVDEILTGTNLLENVKDIHRLAKSRNLRLYVHGLAHNLGNDIDNQKRVKLGQITRDKNVIMRIHPVPNLVWADVFSLLGASWGLRHSFPPVSLDFGDKKKILPEYNRIYEEDIYKKTGRTFREVDVNDRKYNVRRAFAKNAFIQAFKNTSLDEKYKLEEIDGVIHVKGKPVNFPDHRGILLAQHRAHLLQDPQLLTPEDKILLDGLEVDNYTLVIPRRREAHERMMRQLKETIKEELEMQSI